MSKVLKLENVGKQYRLGEVGTGTLSHDLNRWWARVRGKEDPFSKIGDTNDRTSKANSEYVWALEDINFEVEEGDVIGVVGRNGAGKSTLLKILSQVTGPSTGKIFTRGRIAALLEVGTGFHPELTGRENVYLNGAILGMTKVEIKRQFDEIVSFAGVERYVDTPVKRYSSGMLVRLGFAVAAHLNPEILIVDEVLAVGDLEFQKKCLGKMEDISSSGRTIIFVSHNMKSVLSLCKKGLLIDKGKLLEQGAVGDIVAKYISSHDNKVFATKILNSEESKSTQGFLRSINLLSENQEVTSLFKVGESWSISIEFCICKRLKHVILAAGIQGALGDWVNTTWSSPKDLVDGVYRMSFRCDNFLLEAGDYFITVGLSSSERTIEYHEQVLGFRITEVPVHRLDTRIIRYNGNGIILSQMSEELEKV